MLTCKGTGDPSPRAGFYTTHPDREGEELETCVRGNGSEDLGRGQG